MRIGQHPRLARAIAMAAGAVVLASCSAEVEAPSEQEAREAGRDYGEAIVDTLGSRATADELEALCGKGAKEEGMVRKGREGDESDLEVDAFVDACLDVVSKN